MSRSSLFAAGLALILAACASAPAAESSRIQTAANTLQAEDITRASSTSVLEALQRLRPQWQGSVYVNGFLQGDMNELSNIPVRTVRRVEWYEPQEAAERFGTSYGRGAIHVVTR